VTRDSRNRHPFDQLSRPGVAFEIAGLMYVQVLPDPGRSRKVGKVTSEFLIDLFELFIHVIVHLHFKPFLIQGFTAGSLSSTVTFLTGVHWLKERIWLITRQEQGIKSEIAAIVRQDTELSERLELLTSIPGIGKLTAVIILAQTNGFELIRDKKQLVSYARLDV
jgi:hypothetical protein